MLGEFEGGEFFFFILIWVGSEVTPALNLGKAVGVDAFGALDRLNFLEDISVFGMYGITE